MSQKPNKVIVEIACAGCGRTQRVRASKVRSCDGYTCSLSHCKQNPNFKTPTTPPGWICLIEIGAAGGFSGWTLRPATEDEYQSIERAKSIRDVGMRIS